MNQKHTDYKLSLYTSYGVLISSFTNINTASAATGIDVSTIEQCLKNRKSDSLGFLWREYREDEDRIIKLSNVKGTEFFIPGHVPSSKNSKQWTGKYLVSSKNVYSYIKYSYDYYQTAGEYFRKSVSNWNKPLMIGFHFVRQDKRKYDWINPLQTVQDLMVKYKWIEDDNVGVMYPMPYEKYAKNQYSTINKIIPGVWITVM